MKFENSFTGSERMVYYIFDFGGLFSFLFQDHHPLNEEDDRKHLFLGLLLRNCQITEVAELHEFLIFSLKKNIFHQNLFLIKAGYSLM